MVITLAVLSAALFLIGLYGVLAKHNAVVVLFSLELMLQAVNLNLVSFAQVGPVPGLRGHVFALFSMGVAAAGAAVGLALLLALYRYTGTTDVRAFSTLRDKGAGSG